MVFKTLPCQKGGVLFLSAESMFVEIVSCVLQWNNEVNWVMLPEGRFWVELLVLWCSSGTACGPFFPESSAVWILNIF